MRLNTKERRNPALGNQYTFVALDADTKLIPSFTVGMPDDRTAQRFMFDLQSRLRGRVKLTSDGFTPCMDAVEVAWGTDVDYAQLVKMCAAVHAGPGRYSPPRVSEVASRFINGDPNPSRISAAYVERQNLTIRMARRRSDHLMKPFNKKLEDLRAALALHFTHYDIVRIHRTSGPTLRWPLMSRTECGAWETCYESSKRRTIGGVPANAIPPAKALFA